LAAVDVPLRRWWLIPFRCDQIHIDDNLVTYGAAMTLRNGYRKGCVTASCLATAVALAATGCTTKPGAHAIGTTPASMVQSSEDTIRKVFGAELAPEATEVAICESDLNPNAVSKSNDHGLFQINIINVDQWTEVTGQPWSAVYDPVWNTRFTKKMWEKYGWEPWVCKYVLGL
jgi:hypothetical protein